MHVDLRPVIKATMAKLEKDKGSLNLDPDTDAVLCTNFALLLFARADKRDRTADLEHENLTIRQQFMAAGQMLRVCEQFGPLDPELEQKRHYALARTAEISRAVTQRAPIPPPASLEPTLMTATDEELLEELQEMKIGQMTKPYPFQPYMKVLYLPPGESSPVKGTIGKIESNGIMVALFDRIIVADPASLALDVSAGSPILYEHQEAVVVEVDLSHWPPMYTIKLASGEALTVAMETLLLPRSSGEMSSPLAPPPPTHLAPLQPIVEPTVAVANLAVPEVTVASIPGFQPSLKAVTEAHKMCKSAASALAFEDVPTAIKLLNDTLRLLTQP